MHVFMVVRANQDLIPKVVEEIKNRNYEVHGEPFRPFVSEVKILDIQVQKDGYGKVLGDFSQSDDPGWKDGHGHFSKDQSKEFIEALRTMLPILEDPPEVKPDEINREWRERRRRIGVHYGWILGVMPDAPYNEKFEKM